jgi:hypothetical protein
LLIQSPGVSIGRAQGSPTYINRTAAHDKLADRLSCGRLMVQGLMGQTDAYT